MTAITKIDGGNVHAGVTGDPMIAMIERIATSPELPIERMTAIMDLRERQMDKEAEQEFNRAFAAAMAEMPTVLRTGFNPHLRRKYATLDDLISTTRPVLAKHGLSLNWQTGVDNDQIWVRAIVRHSSGHQITTEERGPRDKSGSMNLLQGGGSTQTYLKRYSGFSILGMASGDEVDDDGRSAGSSREGESITQDQLNEMRDLIAKAGIEESVVLIASNIGALESLPAKEFARVKARLEKTIKAKVAK